jgi:hypothetical protein
VLPVSVCLIARDEERHIARLIESVRGLVAEIVMVDTGSRDATMDIARKLGARVLQSPWSDDFSAARNVAIAAATQPWILSVDADQELPATSRDALGAALQRAAMAQVVHIDLLGPDKQPVSRLASLRLWRNDPRIRYQGRVHEDVSASLLAIGCGDWPDSGVLLRDHGYVDAGERQRKRARNLALLRRAVQEHPDDLYLAFKLATTLPEDLAGERLDLLCQAAARVTTLSADTLSTLPFVPRLLAATAAAVDAAGRHDDALAAVALACDVLRLDLAAGRLNAVAAGLDSVSQQAAALPQALPELMLLSAELALAAGDAAAAADFAQAACANGDARALALRDGLG